MTPAWLGAVALSLKGFEAKSAPVPAALVPEAQERRGGLGMAAWRWFQARRSVQSRAGRLRVRETVSLGEKRFAAVLEVDGRQFLVGGGSAGLSLLSELRGMEEPGLPGETSASRQGAPAFSKVAGPGVAGPRLAGSGVNGSEVDRPGAAPGTFADALRQSLASGRGGD